MKGEPPHQQTRGTDSARGDLGHLDYDQNLVVHDHDDRDHVHDDLDNHDHEYDDDEQQ